jgi:F-type H+-transporting ATPase subunit a
MPSDGHSSDPFDPANLFGHVQDGQVFHFPGHLTLTLPPGVTKFMVLELVAAVLVITAFVWLARRCASGRPPRGKMWNLLEAMLLFIRDQVARPAIGRHDADKFLPFLWTLFFFVLTCNLLGMVPWAGSPTGALAVTGSLALCSFVVTLGAGMMKMGPVGFWTGQVPHMDLPPALAVVLKPMIFVLEVGGLFIKHGVLAIRLLANMMAGHLVLGVILGFIALTAGSAAWFGVMPVTVFGAAALSLLELFVAFLQAYIFVYLSALFIGMAVHPH